MKKLYGVYSAKQALNFGTYRYKTPDGSIISVTEVSNNPGCPNNRHPDKEDHGEVIEFMGIGSLGKLGLDIENLVPATAPIP